MELAWTVTSDGSIAKRGLQWTPQGHRATSDRRKSRKVYQEQDGSSKTKQSWMETLHSGL